MPTRALVVLAMARVAFAQTPTRDATSTRFASITGRVISASDHSPIRKARVAIVEVPERDPVFSDDQGRFSFDELRAGTYTITVSKAGFATTRYGARRMLDPARPIDLAAATSATVVVAVPRGGVITGIITDDLGEPVVGTTVSACLIVRSAGQRRVVRAKIADTDDRGEYRIGGLAAGRYVVSTTSVPLRDGGLMIRGPLSLGPTVDPVETYYPGVPSAAAAEELTVNAGDELPSIDISVRRTRPARLVAEVVDAVGTPASGFINLISTDTHYGEQAPIRDGRSILSHVAPGEWLLVARGPAGAAMMPVALGPGDTATTVVLTKGGSLSGHVVFEGTGAPNGEVVLAAAAGGSVEIASLLAGSTSRSAPDGTFSFSGLFGRRTFILRSAPAGWRLKSLSIAGKSLLDTTIEFTGHEALTGAEAVVTKRHTRVVATVARDQRTEPTSLVAVLFPTDRGRLANPDRWARCVRANQRGEFVFDDMPAADYLAIALSDIDDSRWATLEYLDPLRPAAVPVHLPEDGDVRVTIPEVQMR